MEESQRWKGRKYEEKDGEKNSHNCRTCHQEQLIGQGDQIGPGGNFFAAFNEVFHTLDAACDVVELVDPL